MEYVTITVANVNRYVIPGLTRDGEGVEGALRHIVPRSIRPHPRLFRRREQPPTPCRRPGTLFDPAFVRQRTAAEIAGGACGAAAADAAGVMVEQRVALTAGADIVGVTTVAFQRQRQAIA